MSFGSEAIRLLQEYEVDTVFGIPGVHTIEYYRGITETGIRGVVPRHEQGAGFMADGYARISNKPGVCVLVSGPGVLNAATPIAQAWHDSIPLLVLAASTESELRGKNRGPLHDVPDQSLFFEQLTDKSVTISDPDEFAEVIGKVFASWQVNRPRPVHISIPFDVLSADVSPIKKYNVALDKHTASKEDLDKVVKLIKESEKVLLICGGGARNSSAEIQKLAEALQAPVITTGNARGLVPHDHPLNAGTTIAFKESQSLIQRSDLVIAIGTEFSDVDIIYTGKRIPQPKRLIRVDLDKTQLQSGYEADLGIVSDASDFAVSLLQVLNSVGYKSNNSQATADATCARTKIDWTEQSKSHFPWLDVIDKLNPKNSTIAIDSTQLAYTGHHYLPWSSPRKWLAPYGLGTLGPALPMGIGAKVASPDEPVIVIAGDGGSLFTISELATARDIGGTLVMIIWDNAGYAEIRDSFDRAKANRNGVDVNTFDLVKIAQGFGLNAQRVRTPNDFAESLQRALKSNMPSVIVITEPGSPADIK